MSAALSRMGETVLQMGCDPKRDSIATLCGKLVPTILDTMRDNDGAMTEELMAGLVHKGYSGVLGVESGGPRPGVGCAGAGIINNMRGVKNEEKIVEAVAEKMGLPVIMHIPRS